MNEFRIRETGEVITEQQLRQSGESVLPDVIDVAACDFCEVDPVLPAPQPQTTKYQTVARIGAVLDALGNWVQAWEVRDLPLEAVAAMQQRDLDDLAAYLKEVRALREQLLNRLAGIGFAAFVQTDQPTVDAVLTARQQLLDITTIPAVQTAYAAGDLVALKAAVKAEYASIVASVPAALVNAFDQVDQ